MEEGRVDEKGVWEMFICFEVEGWLWIMVGRGIGVEMECECNMFRDRGVVNREIGKEVGWLKV